MCGGEAFEERMRRCRSGFIRVFKGVWPHCGHLQGSGSHVAWLSRAVLRRCSKVRFISNATLSGLLRTKARLWRVKLCWQVAPRDA